MNKQMDYKYLTGVKPTGQFHIGNFASTIKPILDKNIQEETLVLIADLHSLTKQNFKDVKQYKKEIFCIFKSYGINNIIFQSDIKNLGTLYWILSCFTAKGLLNRAHGYKASVDLNNQQNKDSDKGIFMGEYTYPILMTADLVLFNCENVFIGQDQKQHIDIARDIINKFNYDTKSSLLKVPEAMITIDQNILGLDGRKMSKSYNNTIPLMCSEKTLRKKINSVLTNNKLAGEPKEYDCPLTSIFDIFASKEAKLFLKERMDKGESWKHVKEYVFNVVDDSVSVYKNNYEMFIKEDKCIGLNTEKYEQKIEEIKEMFF
jgi:tryptophanyl-tRNA synthetase